MRFPGVLLLGLAACSAPAAPVPCPTLQEADRDLRQGELSAAEEKYHHQLDCDVPDRERMRALQGVGECLRRREFYSEARLVFELIVAWPIPAESDHLWSTERNVKGRAQMGIGECYEAEGRWEEALAAYRKSHFDFPVRGECGNANLEQKFRELDNIARCIRRLEAR